MTAIPNELAKSENLLVQEIGDEAVILDLDSEFYFALEGVGLRFWQLLDELDGFDAIIDQLLGEYEVERAQLEADLRDFVARLLDKGLVRERSAEA